MNIQQIILMIVIFFLGFINFEGIVESLFYGPQKTYTIGLLYDSKKRQSKTNISLYESFSMQFLHRSENKLQFLQLLNFEQYKTNVQKLFMKVLPITQIMLLPWRLNSSNIEFLIVNVDYILVNSKFKTVISMYQFDETQEVGFVPYYSIDLEGKPTHIFKNNDSVHIQIISKDSHELISVLPSLIFKQKSLISRFKLNTSMEVLCWDETINYLVYILTDDPTVMYVVDTQQSEQKKLTIKLNSAALLGGLLFYPLKISLIENQNTTKIVLTLLVLKKQSISLRYIQFNKIMNTFKEYKNGVLSNDIGVNPKQFQKMSQSFRPVHFYQPSMDIYIFYLRKLYFINLRSHKDKHYSLELSSVQVSKIISFDDQFRLMLQYISNEDPQSSILIIVLLNQDYTEKLRQEIGVFEECYDITICEDGEKLYLIVATEHQYFDVYYLMEHDNPSIVKSTAKKLLATYALYKFSGLRLFENYLNYF